jgi:hypothetical protein
VALIHDIVPAGAVLARLVGYFAAREGHIECWRRAGSTWVPSTGAVPVDSMQAAAVRHPKVRRHALGVLDHAANDASTGTFRARAPCAAWRPLSPVGADHLGHRRVW